MKGNIIIKNKRSLFLLVLSFLLLLTLVTPAIAAENATVVHYADDEVYIFTIQPGSIEWEAFETKQEKLDVCQIPEQKLSTMTDDALLATVLSYPLIHDYFAFNDMEMAFNTIYADFNGLRALLDRENITDVLLIAYSEADVMTRAQYEQRIKSTNTSDFVGQFFLTQTLEFLVLCDQIENGEYTREQYKALSVEVSKKEAARVDSELYSTYSDIYQQYTSENTVQLMAGENYTLATVYTPKGSSVSTFYNRSPDWTQAEKNQLLNSARLSYPNATYQRDPTVKYNCHSYAWYSQSNNSHWINYPSVYMTDGSYRSSGVTTGAKVYYYNGDHSAIVTNPSGAVYVSSKWGPSGQYIHMLNDCPYTHGVRYYVAN